MTKRRPHVVLGIPTGTGYPHHQACDSILRAIIEFSQFAETTLSWAPGALVYKARQKILQDAIKCGADFLFFLDDDMLLGEGCMTPLWKALKAAPFTAISGIAPMRNLHTRLCVSWNHPEGLMDWDAFPGEDRLEANPVWPVSGFGAACVLIDLKKLAGNLSHLSEDGKEWDPDDEWQNPFLPVKVVDSKDGKNVVLGEDLAFCYQIRQGGGKLAIHYHVRPGHFITAPLQFDDFLYERQFQAKLKAAKEAAKPKILVP